MNCNWPHIISCVRLCRRVHCITRLVPGPHINRCRARVALQGMRRAKGRASQTCRGGAPKTVSSTPQRGYPSAYRTLYGHMHGQCGMGVMQGVWHNMWYGMLHGMSHCMFPSSYAPWYFSSRVMELSCLVCCAVCYMVCCQICCMASCQMPCLACCKVCCTACHLDQSCYRVVQVCHSIEPDVEAESLWS